MFRPKQKYEMAFIDMNLGAGVKDPEVAPEGRYDLIIDAAEIVNNKEGKPNVRCRVLFDGYPDYAAMFHYIALPRSDDDQDKIAIKQRMAKAFLQGFGVEFTDTGFEIAGLSGARGAFQVGQEMYTADGGQERTTNRIALPKIEAPTE